MIILKNDLSAIEKVCCSLLNGDVVIIPTDTVYGFSGLVPFSKEKIQKIKGRDENKPFIQLIANPNDIFKYTNDDIPKKIFSLWPAPLTIIVNLKPELCNEKDFSTVAFRCPDDIWLRTIIERCGSPIYSTSVNRSGLPILTDIEKM
ncbi:MAG: L-threonylcarbamoyladenylate synthase, partial [Treponema sp.]|nr:L-threonylcarbamoyladenylate synthase [Treponema sp.]